ncbi:MAG: methyltransferase domain-containing protein [Snowella sp.]|nr:methyltransferase domain-containing protein [Snowella sp.]
MNIFSYPLVWPSISDELEPFLKYCKGIVLNAGSGNREIQLGQKNLGIDIDTNNNPDIVADLHRIPLQDESVDTIVSIAVLEHTRYAWIVAQEFHRVLRSGGFGIIAVPFLQPQHACPYDFIRFTRNGLTELMEYVGFEIIETQSVHHFGQTVAWLLWEYLQVNRPRKITWPFWYFLINQLSKGRLLGKDSPNTHNTEYVIVHKPGDGSVRSPYYEKALSNLDSPDWFFPLLACPQSYQPLYSQGDHLVSVDGNFTYSFREGRPHLFPGDGEFRIQVENLVNSSKQEHNPITANTQNPLNSQNELLNNFSEKSFIVDFQSSLKDIFPQSTPPKVAILATTEYEGIFKNGGVGTYYKNLAKVLDADGWYLILLLCDPQPTPIDLTRHPELKHIFLTSEIEQCLNLKPIHSSMLAESQPIWFDYQSVCCLFFIQAILTQFKNSQVYVEFHEMSGIGYRTIQAKQAKCLEENCQVAVTMHSGHEWVYEANEKLVYEHNLDGLWKVCHYEQASFEDADLTFFPSHFLKNKVESYGWYNHKAKHMPYFIPKVTSD